RGHVLVAGAREGRHQTLRLGFEGFEPLFALRNHGCGGRRARMGGVGAPAAESAMVQSSWRAMRWHTAVIRLSSGMENCAGRLERHSLASLMVAAAFAPATRSLISTSPLARSLLPWMTTHGAPRLSAYFICAFIPALPRYISARMRACGRDCAILW